MPPAGEVKVRDVNVTETLTTTKDAERRSERPYTTWLAPVLYGVILVGAALVAYWAMFEQFAAYDDAGYFSSRVSLFNQGHTLYDQVYSEFGPFSYELWRAVFAVAGQPFTIDSARVAIVGLWLLTSLLLGISAQRLTRRLSIGVITLVLSFAVLVGLDKEPMHPNGVACLLLAVIVAIVAFLLPSRPRAGFFALGATLAAVVLTKINVGVFAALAAFYAAAMALPALRRVAALRWLAAAAVVGIGPALMLGKLTQPWVQDYAVLGAAGGLAVVLTTYPLGEQGAEAADHSFRWLGWLLTGFAVCAAVVVGVLLAFGTSLEAFVQDVFLVPLGKGAGFTAPVEFTREVMLWATIGAAAAYLTRRWGGRRADLRQPELSWAVGRGLAGLLIWTFCLRDLHLGRLGDPIALALPLAWVAAIPSIRDDGTLQARFIRVFIPTLAVLQGLTAYPVAGTHVEFGSFLFVICGAICCADGWSELNAWAAARKSQLYAVELRIRVGVFAVALATVLALAYVANPIIWERRIYASRAGLTIAGAKDLRLPEARAEHFEEITTLLRARCHSVFSLPPMLSFNLWSGLPEPSDITAEPFWNLLTSAQERTALARAKATPGLCLVSNQLVAEKWGEGNPPPQVPLIVYMERAFVPVAEIGDYVVAVRRQASHTRRSNQGGHPHKQRASSARSRASPA
jgi:hypothetical protein